MNKVTTQEESYSHICPKYGSWWEYDAQGIELCKVCDECVEYKLSRYRPEILTGYNQSDVDEQIEEEDNWPISDMEMGY